MKSEPVVTVGLRRKNQSQLHFRSLMEELKRLVETAGGHVVQEFSQSRDHPEPGTLIGTGKAAELGHAIKELNVKTVIFDDDLTAAQQKNVEKIMQAKIIDRTRLILDIFAKRARSREGQLQVELAQLNYLVPRLTGAWRGYSQQVGGIETRGPGERKIEVERRYVRERIKRLQKEIESVQGHREHIRKSREAVPIPQISLIGYTNVGKSTLLNTLVGTPEAYADDKLFATLDPTTRRVKLPSGQMVLFTDTVGFIQKLPTTLIAAFQATLEEATRAAILVHVVDVSAEDWREQQKTVMDVVKNLKADHIPMITAYNKIDQLSPEKTALNADGTAVLISAKSGQGLPGLLSSIEKILNELLVEVTFHLPYSKRSMIQDIYKTGYVLSQEPTDEGTTIRVRMDPSNWERFEHQLRNGTR